MATLLTPLTPVTSQAVVGQAWPMSIAVAVDGYAVSATVVLSVTDPDGTVTTPTVSVESNGLYEAEPMLTKLGRWIGIWTVSGTAVGLLAFSVDVQSVPAGAEAGGLPSVEDLGLYLDETTGSRYDDTVLQSVLDAETAAQRARCRTGPAYPADLREALLRRCARNLAARAVPVTSFSSFDGSATVTRVPATDAEVARLEGPYRRLVIG